MADQIAQPPNVVGHTSFTQPGVATKIATPPAGTVGPIEPTYLLQGVGVPSLAAPPGTLYVNTAGTTADTMLYVMITTTWTAMLGAT